MTTLTYTCTRLNNPHLQLIQLIRKVAGYLTYKRTLLDRWRLWALRRVETLGIVTLSVALAINKSEHEVAKLRQLFDVRLFACGRANIIDLYCYNQTRSRGPLSREEERGPWERGCTATWYSPCFYIGFPLFTESFHQVPGLRKRTWFISLPSFFQRTLPATKSGLQKLWLLKASIRWST